MTRYRTEAEARKVADKMTARAIREFRRDRYDVVMSSVEDYVIAIIRVPSQRFIGFL